MAQTAAYALAHTFLPNLTKLKGASTVVAAIERNEKAFFDPVWVQAHVAHDPNILAVVREPYRIAVITLPAPKEMGEAFFVAWVIKKADPAFCRYFTLEHDYVLAKQANRTVLCEREGAKHSKYGDGPPVTGTFAADAPAFIASIMERIVPTTVTRT